MYRKKVNIDLMDTDSIDNAISEMESFVTDVIDRTEWTVERCAEEIQKEAEIRYVDAAADGNNDVHVRTSIFVDGSATVTAYGSDVLFAEFGAGATADSGHEWANIVGDIYPTSWSASPQGTGEYYRSRFEWNKFPGGIWHYKKVRYSEVKPTRAMLNSFHRVVNNVYKIANEVFR